MRPLLGARREIHLSEERLITAIGLESTEGGYVCKPEQSRVPFICGLVEQFKHPIGIPKIMLPQRLVVRRTTGDLSCDFSSLFMHAGFDVRCNHTVHNHWTLGF